MSIDAGTRLGRYEIRSKIGEGGMGEVYLAEDTELERPVALKLLPADVTEDGQRMKRFVQEARAASALNHPNILTVYEIGSADGARFISTEYVRGETLRRRLARGRLTLRESFEIALQVAAALAAAHEAGIVHRDIKPDNVMLRPDGLAKVLDFGLAKLTEQQRAGGPADTEAPTRALVQTAPGVVMGTAAYMSPEQARGLETDARTDIWSCGVVLYEMLTGRAPFGGETASDIIAAILKTDPAPLPSADTEAPAELQRIVRKALQKHRDERYQTIKDLLLDLKSLKRELEFADELERSAAPTGVGATSAAASAAHAAGRLTAGDAATGGTAGAAAAPPTSSAEYVAGEIRRHKRGVLAALAVVVAAGAAYAAYRYAFQSQPAAARFERVKLMRITTEGNLQSVAVSPDGKYIAYALLEAGKRSLWTKHLATDSRVQIVAPAEATIMTPYFFSPDGGYVFYGQEDEQHRKGALFQVAVLGGPPKKILTDFASPVGLSPDGRALAFARYHPGAASEQYQVWLADADGASERRLWACSEPQWLGLNGVSWSPDGKLLTVDYGKEEGGNHMTVGSISVEDGTFKVITPEQRWNRVGRIAWFNDGSGMAVVAQEKGPNSWQIWRVSYPGGAARRITNDLHNYGFTSLTLTADSRTLVALQVEGTAGIWIAPEGDARRARAITSRGGGGGFDWTPDGRLVFASNVGGKQGLWVMNADGGEQKPLLERGSEPQVSPDGRYVFFASQRSKTKQVWRADGDGSHPKQLTEGSGVETFALTPDGRWVIYSLYAPSIWKVPAEGGTPTKVADASAFTLQVSPDGRLLAYVGLDAQTNRLRLTVLALDGGAVVKTLDLPVTARSLFRWSPDSRAVVYVDTRGDVSNLWRLPLDGGAPAQLTDFKSDHINFFAYSRDGKQLALSRGNQTRDALLISEEK